MGSAYELSTAQKLGNPSNSSLSSYVQNVRDLVSAKGVDAFTSATLTQEEMPDGYAHVDPADSLAAFLAGKTVVEYSPEYFYPSAGYTSPSTPQQLQYIDAPYAELYGMDVSTAYQEALANTAYQRKVSDLKAAGLNPVLGISGSGAASFYGSPISSPSGGVSYGSVGSGKKLDNLKDFGTYLPYIAGAGVTLATLQNLGPSKAVAAGSATTQLLSSINNWIK